MCICIYICMYIYLCVSVCLYACIYILHFNSGMDHEGRYISHVHEYDTCDENRYVKRKAG